MTGKIRLASDVGGTFTDLVYYEVDEASGALKAVHTAKAHTTPDNFEQGVMETLDLARINIAQVEFFAHGTTVVINALTERKGVKTGLITTRGFRDVLEIARGDRPDFFNLRYKKPKPFVPRYLRLEINERMTHHGEVHTPLALDELPALLGVFRREGVEAIAVCLLHAYANPAHEVAVMDAIKEAWPEVSAVASHQISREWREYERTNTTVASAYVQPIADRYLTRLQERLAGNGFAGAFYVMQSNGGIDTAAAARATPITMVESGPASGVLGAAELGKAIGEFNIIALDIGGTTAKCSLIDQGRVQVTSKYMIERSRTFGGYPIMTPVVDIVEIGNGGGSIAWIDEDGKLHVGPKSAGAVPGPVAYGQGGTEPTTTDANLLAGRINPERFFGGKQGADMTGVRRVFADLGAELDLSPEETARGVIRIADQSMVNALKLVSINRGYDPRDFTMVAFGGGGAMHAAALATELNIPKIVIPAHSAVFSAWGMLMSDLRRDFVRTRPMTLEANAMADIAAIVDDMKQEALSAFEADGFGSERLHFDVYADMRYEGQEHTVRVLLPETDLTLQALSAIVEIFHANYQREYTYRLKNQVQLVGFHLVVHGRIEQPPLPRLDSGGGDGTEAIKDTRVVDFDTAGVCTAQIYDRDKLEAGAEFTGPAIIEETGSTTVVFPDQHVRVDEFGNLHIRIKG